MPIVAPWLQPTDALAAIQAGTGAGSNLRSIQNQARATELGHQDRMAQIEAERRALAERLAAEAASQQRQIEAQRQLQSDRIAAEQEQQMRQTAIDLALRASDQGASTRNQIIDAFSGGSFLAPEHGQPSYPNAALAGPITMEGGSPVPDFREGLQRDKLAQDLAIAKMQDELRQAQLDEKSRQFDARSQWSGPITLKDGRVVQINNATGDYREVARSGPTPMTATQTKNFYGRNSAMRAEEEAFLKEKANGVPIGVLRDRYPTLFKYEPYRSRYVSLLGKKPNAQLTLDDLLSTLPAASTNTAIMQEKSQTNNAADVYYDLVNGSLQRVGQ